MGKRPLIWVSIASTALALATTGCYLRDMRRASRRLHDRSALCASRWGAIEYREGGSGDPVLVVHGSGGGFDQGELVAQALLGDRFRWIAPSRFGYLRSTYHAGATFDDQAHAFAALLDHLRLDRVAVVALSHGGPSALLFALLYPDRVTSLTLVSAGVASSAAAEQADANRKGDALAWMFQGDFRYWALSTAFRTQFLDLMGAPRSVIAELSPEQRRLADRVIEIMNPVSRRAAGVRLDNRAAMPNERIAGIRAPTLILHARDDTLQLFRNAEFAAATIPGAHLMAFDRGGHLLLAVEQPTLQRLIASHLLDHAGPRSPEPPTGGR